VGASRGSRAEQSRAEQSRAEQSRAEQSRAQHGRHEDTLMAVQRGVGWGAAGAAQAHEVTFHVTNSAVCASGKAGSGPGVPESRQGCTVRTIMLASVKLAAIAAMQGIMRHPRRSGVHGRVTCAALPERCASKAANTNTTCPSVASSGDAAATASGAGRPMRPAPSQRWQAGRGAGPKICAEGWCGGGRGCALVRVA
jgi:hypothetical protein